MPRPQAVEKADSEEPQSAGSVPLPVLLAKHFDEVQSLKKVLIQQAVAALDQTFSMQKRTPVIRTLLAVDPKLLPPELCGVRPDIFVTEGSIDAAILVADKYPFPEDDERRLKLRQWADGAPQRRHFFVDELPDVKQGTPEAIYKIATSTLEQEEKRFNDLESKARNISTGNSFILGTGSLAIISTLKAFGLPVAGNWYAGVPCILAVILGVIASIVLHIAQRTKEWKGRPVPSVLLENYLAHSPDHLYRAAAKTISKSYDSLSQTNDSVSRMTAIGVWFSLASLISFFITLVILLVDIFKTN